MRRIVNVTFADDLIEAALGEASDPCKLIFPTEISAAQARQRFMPDWRLQDCEFLSMKEFKNSLLLPPGPVASDDRRLLCLYQSLSEEDREYFHSGGYFDIVEWGNHFFQLFEELSDECVDPDALRDTATSFGLVLLGWQEQYLDRILDVRARYREILDQSGLCDPIFSRRIEAFLPPTGHCRYIFVNQYYYSKLEKELLTALEKEGNELVIIFQTDGQGSGTEQLESPQVALERINAQDIRTKKVEVIERENEDQMVLTFLEYLVPASEESVIVDSQFYSKHYRRLFSPEYFAASQSQSMVETGIYAFLQILFTQLKALDATQKKIYVPLRQIVAACCQPGFLRYYRPDWGRRERSELLEEARQLLSQDILYVDSSLELFQTVGLKGIYERLPELLKSHFDLLTKLASVGTPAELIGIIDAPGGLSIQAMCAEPELLYSDVLERFYERLANFASLTHIPVVSDWQGLFASKGIALAANILQLFLEALTSAAIRYKTSPSPEGKRFDISNLLDLRDLSYDTTVFFHAIEGQYPSNPAPAWLFNEYQRGKLGLKNYAELREREHYYFFRQIFTSQKVYLFTYRDQEKDIEPGSFVTELLAALAGDNLAGILAESQAPTPTVRDLYLARAQNCSQEQGISPASDQCASLQDLRERPNEFFVLPPDPEDDLGPECQLEASYQSISQLDKNPFVWYIKYHGKLQRVELRPEETISRKLHGALLHDYMARVLTRLAGEHRQVSELAPVLDSQMMLTSELTKLIGASLYHFKLPKNYNHEFLTSVIFDRLAGSMREFFKDFLVPQLQDTSFELIPEDAERTAFREPHKVLLTREVDGVEYKLAIRGIADLRMESPQRNLIVDFKTGSHDADQLMLYEFYYYLLNGEYNNQELFSTFWMILDEKHEETTSEEKREKWRDRLAQDLVDVITKGYGQGKNVQARQELRGITRADLYHPAAGGAQ